MLTSFIQDFFSSNVLQETTKVFFASVELSTPSPLPEISNTNLAIMDSSESVSSHERSDKASSKLIPDGLSVPTASTSLNKKTCFFSASPAMPNKYTGPSRTNWRASSPPNGCSAPLAAAPPAPPLEPLPAPPLAPEPPTPSAPGCMSAASLKI